MIALGISSKFNVEQVELKKEEIRPTSMIDVTDGLASDLLHGCRLSGTGMERVEIIKALPGPDNSSF